MQRKSIIFISTTLSICTGQGLDPSADVVPSVDAGDSPSGMLCMGVWIYKSEMYD